MQISNTHPHPIPGLACLHIATLQRNRPLMELLLHYGADIDTQVRGPVPPPAPAPGRRACPAVRSGGTPPSYPEPQRSMIPLEALG